MLPRPPFAFLPFLSTQALGSKQSKALPDPLASSITEFYMTDSISRASKVMAKCVRARAEQAQRATEAVA